MMVARCAAGGSGLRRVVAGAAVAVVMALAILPVAACSSDDTKPAMAAPNPSLSAGATSSVPDEAQATTASSVSASPVAVTAEALSDPATGYVVESVPEGMSPGQEEIVRAYVAYDRATWDQYRTMDGDLSRVEATTSGGQLEVVKASYEDFRAKGLHQEGQTATKIIYVTGNESTAIANVEVCSIQTDIRNVSASGEAPAPDDHEHRFHDSVRLVQGPQGWTVDSSKEIGVDDC